MSENKNFKLIKTTPESVLFFIHPVSNPMLTRRIYLTNAQPVVSLPEDWAIGVFQDEGAYTLYQSKCFTFDDNEAVTKAAFDAGVYFDDKLDFTPAKPDQADEVFKILEKGNRSEILKAIEAHGEDFVKNVAMSQTNNLTQNVIRMLEGIFKIQLTLDGE